MKLRVGICASLDPGELCLMTASIMCLLNGRMLFVDVSIHALFCCQSSGIVELRCVGGRGEGSLSELDHFHVPHQHLDPQDAYAARVGFVFALARPKSRLLVVGDRAGLGLGHPDAPLHFWN
jgi:hypothetical protein